MRAGSPVREWLKRHRQACAAGLRRLGHAPLDSALSVLVIAIALLLPAAGLLVTNNVAAMFRSVAAAPLRLARQGAGSIALLLGIGAAAIVFNTVRLQARGQAQLDSASGAARATTDRQLYYFGIFVGLLGGLAALAMIAAAVAGLED